MICCTATVRFLYSRGSVGDGRRCSLLVSSPAFWQHCAEQLIEEFKKKLVDKEITLTDVHIW